MSLSCSILGASGYAGGEIIRLLAGHPALAVTAVSAATKAGVAVAEIHPHLRGAGDLALVSVEEAAGAQVDVCFSCLPGGALEPHLDEVAAPLLVDLADDHRLSASWVYGLTEFARPALQDATRIANPGCYPTASLLALLPFVEAGTIEPLVVIDALSGVSGAGRKNEDRLLFSNVVGSAGAYGPTSHRHVPEIERYLAVFGEQEVTVSFTPHLVPLARGLVVTARAPLAVEMDDDAALEILRDRYRGEPFVEVTSGWPQTKAVAGSNRAHVSARVDRRAGFLVCSAAIDNLGKGAAGSALQNANVALGLEEPAGLTSWGVWP